MDKVSPLWTNLVHNKNNLVHNVQNVFESFSEIFYSRQKYQWNTTKIYAGPPRARQGRASEGLPGLESASAEQMLSRGDRARPAC